MNVINLFKRKKLESKLIPAAICPMCRNTNYITQEEALSQGVLNLLGSLIFQKHVEWRCTSCSNDFYLIPGEFYE